MSLNSSIVRRSISPKGFGEVFRFSLDRYFKNLSRTSKALNLQMFQSLSQQLSAWQHDANIKAIIIEGAGGKAFCAGGDIRSVYKFMNSHQTSHPKTYITPDDFPLFNIEFTIVLIFSLYC